MNKTIKILIYSFVIASILLAACSTPASIPATQETEVIPEQTEPAVTEIVAVTEAVETEPPAENKIILATTTSTQDSGLLDYLLPIFVEQTGIKVDVIAVGTGQALQLGEDGNADVLLVHSRAKEDEFMSAGHGVRREDVMFNDFIVVGPEADTAGIKDIPSAADAFKKIAETLAIFISRGDDSGTHTKELSIWVAAGIEKPSGDWYVSAGQGMGEVLTMAEEQQAYTLSDRATYLARLKEGLTLTILVEGDKALFNPYGVIAVNPEKNPAIQLELANQFIDWITSVETQEKIAEFGKADFGQSLFLPNSTLWVESQSSMSESVSLKVSGKVNQEQAWSAEEVKALPTIDIEYTNSKGEAAKATGVLFSELLKLAEPMPVASLLVFVANDGYTAEASLADVLACQNCLLAFSDDGGFNVVLPDFPKNLQVKGVVELQLK